MLINVTKLIGYKILASDGEIGHVDDMYFDTQDWVLRYLVVDTGPWILGRKVALSRSALSLMDAQSEKISVNLTRDQVKDSPAMDFAQPITREQEVNLYGYYGWPVYWPIPFAGPSVAAPIVPAVVTKQEPVEPDQSETSYLHRFNTVKGYQVHARDGDLGHIKDFVIEDENWEIGYFIVDTGGWFQKGNHVMLAPHWITHIDSDESKVFVDLSKDTIRSSPEFEPDEILENQ